MIKIGRPYRLSEQSEDSLPVDLTTRTVCSRAPSYPGYKARLYCYVLGGLPPGHFWTRTALGLGLGTAAIRRRVRGTGN